jgi:hypothetical protein
MAISWDSNQLPALALFLETKLPLSQGEVVVLSMDIPPNCFAGQVDLSEKEFTVFSNIESPISDITMNVFLAYVVALAYDRSNWSGMPTHDVLFDCMRLVCKTMAEFNEDFSKSLEEHADILEAWHESHAPDGTTTSVDPESLVGSMGASLFSTNPADSKDYGSN